MWPSPEGFTRCCFSFLCPRAAFKFFVLAHTDCKITEGWAQEFTDGLPKNLGRCNFALLYVAFSFIKFKREPLSDVLNLTTAGPDASLYCCVSSKLCLGNRLQLPSLRHCIPLSGFPGNKLKVIISFIVWPNVAPVRGDSKLQMCKIIDLGHSGCRNRGWGD